MSAVGSASLGFRHRRAPNPSRSEIPGFFTGSVRNRPAVVTRSEPLHARAQPVIPIGHQNVIDTLNVATPLPTRPKYIALQCI
jgi:hypothetical protein